MIRGLGPALADEDLDCGVTVGANKGSGVHRDALPSWGSLYKFGQLQQDIQVSAYSRVDLLQ